MKNYLMALMCMAGLTMTMACGGNSGNKGGLATEEQENNEEAVEQVEEASDEDPGVAKCAATLKKGWGISLKQIEPDFAYEKITKGWDKFEGNGANSAAAVYKKKDGSAITDEEFKAWGEKLYALTLSLAQDGKNIRGYDGMTHLTEEEANAEVTLEDCMKDNYFPAWSFRTENGVQRCYITFEKDKEPNYIIVRFAPGLTGNID